MDISLLEVLVQELVQQFLLSFSKWIHFAVKDLGRVWCEFDLMVPRSTVWESLSFFIAEYLTKLVVFEGDLLLPCALCFVSSTGSEVGSMGDASDNWFSFCCLVGWCILLMTGNEGVILWFDIKEFSDFVLIVCLSWECAFWYAAKVDFWTFTSCQRRPKVSILSSGHDFAIKSSCRPIYVWISSG